MERRRRQQGEGRGCQGRQTKVWLRHTFPSGLLSLKQLREGEGGRHVSRGLVDLASPTDHTSDRERDGDAVSLSLRADLDHLSLPRPDRDL